MPEALPFIYSQQSDRNIFLININIRKLISRNDKQNSW
jgi:hypothetical protein